MDSSQDGSLTVFEIKESILPNKDIKQEDWRVILDLKENEGLDCLLTASEFSSMIYRLFTLPPI